APWGSAPRPSRTGPRGTRRRDVPPWSSRGQTTIRAVAAATHTAQTARRLFLRDGHSLAYRAFFALPPSLATSTGQITNAVYGFTSMLIKLLAEGRPDLIAVAFDLGAPTVRLQMDADYKA